MNNKFWHKFYFNIPIIIWSKFFILFIHEVIKYSVNRVANHFWRNFIFVVAVTAFAVFAIFAVVFAVVAVAVLITESIVINNSKLH